MKSLREDRRKQIIDAGLAILREQGLQGLSQPRIAARTGLRQSHLTYYYPTRADLLAAVAQAAVELQASDAQAMARRITTRDEAADVIAAGTARNENTRVLLALCAIAEQEPRVRAMFNTLADGSVDLLTILLERLGSRPLQAHADILQALFIGLSVMQLATGRDEGLARSRAALEAVLALLASRETS